MPVPHLMHPTNYTINGVKTMNTKAIKSLLMMGIITTLGLTLTITESQAQPKMLFVCEQNNQNIPTTFGYINPTDKQEIIIWTKTVGGRTPVQRCKEVTHKLQKIYDGGNRGLITNSVMNRNPVICVAKKSGAKCEFLLMTLEKNENSMQIINGLKPLLYMQQVGPIKQSSSEPQIYYKINFDKFFRNSPTEK